MPLLGPLMSEECIINLLLKILIMQGREYSLCDQVSSSSPKMSMHNKVLLWLLRQRSMLTGPLSGCELVASVNIYFDEI